MENLIASTIVIILSSGTIFLGEEKTKRGKFLPRDQANLSDVSV